MAGDVDSIGYRTDGSIARITLNRPEALNAFDADMAGAWHSAAQRAVDDPRVRAVALDSTGKAFCAGGDVRMMAAPETRGSDIAHLARTISAGIGVLRESHVPVVAVVAGAVAGGGLGVLCAADVIIAGPRARFGGRYANIGLSPDSGASVLLPEVIGARRALQLVLQDVMIDAGQACEWGLVTEVADDPEQRAEEFLRDWSGDRGAAYAAAKRLVRASVGRSFASCVEDEASTIAQQFETEFAQSRIADFAGVASAV